MIQHATPSQNLPQKFNNILLLQKHWFRYLVRGVWILAFCVCIVFPAYLYAVAKNAFQLFGEMPALGAIENPENDLSSEILSADGVSLGRYFRYNRSAVSYDDLPPALINALLASEDHRFYEHSGIDFYAYARVVWGMLTLSNQGGGSTLTQQTAKNLFRTREDELQGRLSGLGKSIELLISKTKEWIIAVRLEENFTKEEIIALYLNTVPFNNNAYGIRIAAETYFNKRPEKLNVQECALLVGLLQGNVIYNPVTHPDRAVRKRNEVLQKVFQHGYIKTGHEVDSLKQLPIHLNFSVQNHNEGPAPYFRSILKKDLLAWCKQRNIDLVESGLKIYTTIDSRLQRYAEEAVALHMRHLQEAFERDWGNRDPWVDDNGVTLKNFLNRKIKTTEAYRNLKVRFGNDYDSIALKLNEKKRMRVFSWKGTRDTLFSSMDSLRYYNRFLQAGLMAMEPETGAVKAWVGGINHTYFKYDHVKQSTRQPGSTFKPFVYGLAMENGFSPCEYFNDISPVIMINGQKYQARNANGTYGDGKSYTLRQGMARSLNTITIQLMDKLKPENVAAFAHRLGITTPLDPVYSLALGTSDVSLYELVGAYSSFVNLGTYTRPFYITRIEDKNGNLLENFLPVSKQVMNENTAYKMVHMLKGGVEERGGTSQVLSENIKSENEIGGKTGTTNNGSDGWYIGITHNLVAGVWVGGDERSIHFPRWGEGSGGKAALPIWNKFMSDVYSDPGALYKKGNFTRPAEFNVNMDCVQYQNEDSVLTVQ